LARGNDGVASAVGAAAHARGLLARDRTALREAVTALDASPRRLDRARAREDCAHAEFPADRERAIELVESAIDIYQECGAHRDRKRATRTLRAWGVRRAGPGIDHRAASGLGLSAKELEVAREVAKGRTNREIGARLYISHHTVDTHLRSIFAKTGVNSRAALGRLLATNGEHLP
jgi:DNA-binding CsgD family transcriptional regulator